VKRRAAFYYDGFNLFHALDAVKDADGNKLHHYKWLDLWKVAEALVDHNTESLVRVVWCSAEDTSSHDKLHRHQAYQRALESVGVSIRLGHFIDAPFKCPNCGPYRKPTEKSSDVNVAVEAVSDAMSGLADSIYLVTADTDQVGTVKIIRDLCEDASVTIVAPFGMVHSQHLLEYATGKRTINESTVISCLFPKQVNKNGKFIVDRPERYDPPPGWKAPSVAAAAAAQKNRAVEVVIKKSRKPKLPGSKP
jgi:uncharacterized LabA/DUF88 family protein